MFVGASDLPVVHLVSIKQEFLPLKNKRIYLGFKDGHFPSWLRRIFVRLCVVITAPPLAIRRLFGWNSVARRIRPVILLLGGRRVAHVFVRVLHTFANKQFVNLDEIV